MAPISYWASSFLLTVALLVTGCGAPQWTRPAPKDRSLEDPAKARIYFMLPQRRPAPIGIYDREEMVGAVDGASYNAVDVQPGEHLFVIPAGWTNGALRATVEAGRTYYVWILLPGEGIVISPLIPGTEKWSEKDQWLADHAYVELDPAVKASIDADEDVGEVLRATVEKVERGEAMVVKELLPEHAEPL